MFWKGKSKIKENIHAMKINREITDHPAHPKHTLRLKYTETPFNCSGCDEAGIGLKYTCRRCEYFSFFSLRRRRKYELHKDCGVAAPMITHPFFKKCQFEFKHLRPDQNMTRKCYACEENIRGFFYHGAKSDIDLHPSCVNLPRVLEDGERSLYLLKTISGPCHHCGGKGPGWGYRSQCKAYNLHVSCAKKLLVESWQASYYAGVKNKIREQQTTIPTLNGSPGYMAGARDDAVKKYCKLAGDATWLVVSAILGDPTAVLAGVVRGLLT